MRNYQGISREQNSYGTTQTTADLPPSPAAGSGKAGQGAQSRFSPGSNSKGAKESNLEKKRWRGDYDRA